MHKFKAYPIMVKPIFKKRPWGGRNLSALLKTPKGKIGEVWFFSDQKDTRSIISNGKYKGKKLGALITEHSKEILGTKLTKKYGKHFPLLIKFLDSNEALSVQVHPNDKYAEKHENCWGKTELWYVVKAKPGAKIWAGFNKNLDHKTLRACVFDDVIKGNLQEYASKAGDVFYSPTGTVHARGKGNLVMEIQQNSDITYRLYDWGRLVNGKPRELNVKKALAVVNASKTSVKINQKFLKGGGLLRRPIADCPYFRAAEILALETKKYMYGFVGPSLITLLAGDLKLSTEGNSYIFSKGETVLIPAVLKSMVLEFSKGNHIIVTEIK